MRSDPHWVTGEAEDAALAAAREDWERQQLNRRMNKAISNTLDKYRPARTTKHPKGATKQTVSARKAKNRKNRKANR